MNDFMTVLKQQEDIGKDSVEEAYKLFETFYIINKGHTLSREKVEKGIECLDVCKLAGLDESVRKHFDKYTYFLNYHLRGILVKDNIKASDIMKVYEHCIQEIGEESKEFARSLKSPVAFLKLCNLFGIPYERNKSFMEK